MSAQILEKLQRFQEHATQVIGETEALERLQEVKAQFLGKKSELTEVLKTLGTLTPDLRKEIGETANRIKGLIGALVEEREKNLKEAKIARALSLEAVDVTREGLAVPLGAHHPVMQIFRQSRDIFLSLGFDIGEGPEIETDFYNFAALNIPKDHPARDMQDTFYFPDGHLLRTHTSPVQIRVMEKQKPPIAMVAPGVVYRCDSDQTHTPMFHQVEGLLVDKDIHFGHLKAVVREYLTRIFDTDLKLRFRPSFFPFTEPSAEVDISCVFCQGDGCRVCKTTGWLEIMGCGMVDPTVFGFVDIDPDVYSGFAFGAGLERITMLKYGIHDLRWFFENDVRFLRQFA